MLILNSQSFSCKEKLLNKILLTQKRNPAFSHFALDNLLLLFSRPVVSNSLQPHRLQHTRPPFPSTSPRVCQSSCSLHLWCCPDISSSDCSLLLLPSIFPSIRDFSNESSVPIRWPKYWSFNFSIVLLVNILGWSPFSLTGLISLLSQGLLRVFSSTTVRRHQFFGVLPSLRSRSHNHMWPLGRP